PLSAKHSRHLTRQRLERLFEEDDARSADVAQQAIRTFSAGDRNLYRSLPSQAPSRAPSARPEPWKATVLRELAQYADASPVFAKNPPIPNRTDHSFDRSEPVAALRADQTANESARLRPIASQPHRPEMAASPSAALSQRVIRQAIETATQPTSRSSAPASAQRPASHRQRHRKTKARARVKTAWAIQEIRSKLGSLVQSNMSFAEIGAALYQYASAQSNLSAEVRTAFFEVAGRVLITSHQGRLQLTASAARAFQADLDTIGQQVGTTRATPTMRTRRPGASNHVAVTPSQTDLVGPTGQTVASWNPVRHEWSSIASYYEVLPHPSLSVWRPTREAQGKVEFSFGLTCAKVRIGAQDRLYPIVTDFRNETTIVSMQHQESPGIPIVFNAARQQWEPKLAQQPLAPRIVNEDLIAAAAQTAAPAALGPANAQGIALSGHTPYVQGQQGWYTLGWNSRTHTWQVPVRSPQGQQNLPLVYHPEVDGWRAHPAGYQAPVRPHGSAYVGWDDQLEQQVESDLGRILQRGRLHVPPAQLRKIDAALTQAIGTARGASRKLSHLSDQEAQTVQQWLGYSQPLTSDQLRSWQTTFNTIADNLAKYQPGGSLADQVVLFRELRGTQVFVTSNDRHGRIFFGEAMLAAAPPADLARVALHEAAHFERTFDYFYQDPLESTDRTSLQQVIDSARTSAVNFGTGRQMPRLRAPEPAIQNEERAKLQRPVDRAAMLRTNADTLAHLAIWLDQAQFIDRIYPRKR
ncbi:hypothetical protein, partial [Burkholderia stagnalis]|uniref:hypothetical protein n=1 Tax=Burkholderia stagnalis TaxID=1503054 RepID=UPI001629F032